MMGDELVEFGEEGGISIRLIDYDDDDLGGWIDDGVMYKRNYKSRDQGLRGSNQLRLN